MDKLVEFSGGSQNQARTHGMNVMETGDCGVTAGNPGPKTEQKSWRSPRQTLNGNVRVLLEVGVGVASLQLLSDP